jgi:Rap1a immunity proteins
MNTLKTILAAAIFAALPIAASAADYVSGNTFTEYCSSKNTMIYCHGYARAVGDTLKLWQGISPESAAVCLDAKVNTGQLVDIGLTFIKNNPKERHQIAAALLGAAFADAWPCNKNQPRTNFRD